VEGGNSGGPRDNMSRRHACISSAISSSRGRIFFFCSAILREEVPSRETGPAFRPRETRPIFVSCFEDKHEDETASQEAGFIRLTFRSISAVEKSRPSARLERNRDVSVSTVLMIPKSAILSIIHGVTDDGNKVDTRSNPLESSPENNRTGGRACGV